MSKKIKSLLYLSCFIMVSVFYHNSVKIDSNQQFVSNTIEQEADVVVKPFMENINEIQTN